MIQDDLSAAITDFGVSRVMTSLGAHTGLTTEGSGGTAGFQAVELFSEESRPTKASDVYAFGGLILSVSCFIPICSISAQVKHEN